MLSTVQNKNPNGGIVYMEEKVYKTMGRAGALSIVLGIISIVVGLTSGVMLLISGGRLLVGKSRIMF